MNSQVQVLIRLRVMWKERPHIVQLYRTRSNYPNILIARTARLLILFPSHCVEYAEFLISK